MIKNQVFYIKLYVVFYHPLAYILLIKYIISFQLISFKLKKLMYF